MSEVSSLRRVSREPATRVLFQQDMNFEVGLPQPRGQRPGQGSLKVDSGSGAKVMSGESRHVPTEGFSLKTSRKQTCVLGDLGELLGRAAGEEEAR